MSDHRNSQNRQIDWRWNIPTSWTWSKLDAVGNWSSGGTPSRKVPENYGGQIPWAKIGDLNDGPLVATEEHITERGLEDSAAKLIPPETLMVAMYGASIGKLAISKIECTTNQAIANCRVHVGVLTDYVFYYLRLQKRALVELGQGGAQPNISQEILKNFDIPVAPTNSQQSIVSKIDELFSRIDAGEAALKRAKALVERYRKSILKAAVTGDLTKDWREKNKDKIEPASELLKRILKTRREAWQAAELAKMKAKGKPPKDDTWKKRYVEPAAPDTSELPELPEGWVWASLYQILDIKGGLTVDAKRTPLHPITLPYLRVANVQRGFLKLEDIKSITIEKSKVAELLLKDGDILFNEGGDLDKLGRGWVWRDEIKPCTHQNHVFRGRLVTSECVPELISWYANTIGIEFFLDKGKQTTNLASISLTKLQQLPVPLAPADEQQELRDRCMKALAFSDELSMQVAQSTMKSRSLRQAILRYAFEGKLVAQDPDEELAETTLDHALNTPPKPQAQKAQRRQ